MKKYNILLKKLKFKKNNTAITILSKKRINKKLIFI